jgi:hypothetical protein
VERYSTASSLRPTAVSSGRAAHHSSSTPLSSQGDLKTELLPLRRRVSRAAERVRCYLWVCTPTPFVDAPATPLAASDHRLTCGEQQGNPGQHGNDAARWLRKTKWSLEATDVSARSLAVVQLFDDLQQPSSTWEVSTRTKHEVERILRSDVSSRLVHPASVAPTNAIQGE